MKLLIKENYILKNLKFGLTRQSFCLSMESRSNLNNLKKIINFLEGQYAFEEKNISVFLKKF